MVKKRTNFGLNPFFVCMTNFGHFVILTNIVSLHITDFVGILQISVLKAIPTFQTFLNAFILWFAYQPCIYLNMLFLDKEPRPNYKQAERKRGTFFLYFLTVLLISIFVMIYIVLFSLGGLFGFQSSQVQYLGHVFGIIAMFICIFQYFPQIITTCRLKNHGSLSILMLAIQFPGGFLNAFFMCFGQHEHWTSWLSTMAAAAQQMILFLICIFFKCRNKMKNKNYDELVGDSMSTNRSDYEAIQ